MSSFYVNKSVLVEKMESEKLTTFQAPQVE